MTTHVRLVSTVGVATVPRSLNAALNWAFDEGNWRNALPRDEPIGEAMANIKRARNRLRLANTNVPFSLRDGIEALTVLEEMLDACARSHLGSRLVVE